jgi:prepilin-type N-terminal cleavage/methylation domain-containing protein
VRRGATLVELMVTVAVLGLLAGLAAVSVQALRPPETTERDDALAEARARAVRTGQPVRVRGEAPVLFLPDGRAVGNDVDPLTGARVNAAK